MVVFLLLVSEKLYNIELGRGLEEKEGNNVKINKKKLAKIKLYL